MQAAVTAVPATFSNPVQKAQGVALWLMIASSWFVVVEPSPYEMLFPACLLLFLASGLRVTASVLPLIILLLVYNVGGLASVAPVTWDGDAVMFVVISFYMAATAIFLAFAVTADPLRIMAVIRSAYVIAAVIGAALGIAGYFDVAGMGGAWAPISRAQGTFKDPNVLSTFLIPPALFLIQDFIMARQKSTVLSGGALLVILAGLFLAFSRGAWANMAGATFLMFATTFVVTRSAALRSRVILIAVGGTLAVIALILFALSFEAVRTMFVERASLIQSYDGGETGRFANQLNSLPLLVQMPNGMGPMQFGKLFGEDPHNVYINAFAAYGWTGGLAYFLLIGATIVAGWRAVFTASPLQYHAIAVFCPLIMLIVQGLQIDTDHWRHFYLLLGLMWGLFAASQMATAQAQPNRAHAA